MITWKKIKDWLVNVVVSVLGAIGDILGEIEFDDVDFD